MGITLSIVGLVALLSPGLLFYWAYYLDEDYGNKAGISVPKDQIPVEIVLVGIGSLVIHFIYYLLLYPLCWALELRARPDFVFAALSGAEFEISDINYFVYGRFSLIILYFIGIYLFSFKLGRFAWKTVSDHDLDVRYPWLGLSDWYYIFTGANELRDNESANGVVVYIFVHTSGPGAGLIYMGFLNGWSVGRGGQINYLVLREVLRTPFPTEIKGESSGAAASQEPEEVGRAMVIKGEEIKDFAIEYYFYYSEGQPEEDRPILATETPVDAQPPSD